MKIFLETARLIIREPSWDQLDEAFAIDSDPEVMYYVSKPRTLDKVREWLDKNIQHQNKHGFSFGFVYEKETGKCIGRAGLLYLAYDDTQPDIEIGYRLYKSSWGKGYATELARALIKWGFENLPVDKIVAVIDPQNGKSRRVLEKANMHYAGKTLYYDMEVDRYEILKGN